MRYQSCQVWMPSTRAAAGSSTRPPTICPVVGFTWPPTVTGQPVSKAYLNAFCNLVSWWGLWLTVELDEWDSTWVASRSTSANSDGGEEEGLPEVPGARAPRSPLAGAATGSLQGRPTELDSCLASLVCGPSEPAG